MENTVNRYITLEILRKNFINFALVPFLPNFDIDFTLLKITQQ